MKLQQRKRRRVFSKTAAILYSSRRLYSNDFIDIKIASFSPTSETENARCIGVVSKKIGNAVTRNLLKRRLRSIWHTLDLKTTKYHWIFFCKKGIEKASYETIRIAISTAHQKFLKKQTIQATNHEPVDIDPDQKTTKA